MCCRQPTWHGFCTHLHIVTALFVCLWSWQALAATPLSAVTSFFGVDNTVASEVPPPITSPELERLLVELDACQREWDELRDSQFKGFFELKEGVTKVFVPESPSITAFNFVLTNPDTSLLMCAEDSATRRAWLKLIRARVNRQQEVRFRRFLQDFYLASLLTRKKMRTTALLNTASTCGTV
jgi:hypothetical protein